jgi:hypothetical protein
MHIVMHLCTAAVSDGIAHHRPVKVAPSRKYDGAVRGIDGHIDLTAATKFDLLG